MESRTFITIWLGAFLVIGLIRVGEWNIGLALRVSSEFAAMYLGRVLADNIEMCDDWIILSYGKRCAMPNTSE